MGEPPSASLQFLIPTSSWVAQLFCIMLDPETLY